LKSKEDEGICPFLEDKGRRREREKENKDAPEIKMKTVAGSRLFPLISSLNEKEDGKRVAE
jgi:hypothetical protein